MSWSSKSKSYWTRRPIPSQDSLWKAIWGIAAKEAITEAAQYEEDLETFRRQIWYGGCPKTTKNVRRPIPGIHAFFRCNKFLQHHDITAGGPSRHQFFTHNGRIDIFISKNLMRRVFSHTHCDGHARWNTAHRRMTITLTTVKRTLNMIDPSQQQAGSSIHPT